MSDEEDNRPDRDYEIGYGKPPKSSQFKPGQSGNKKGRPKGAKSMRVLAREMLNEKVEITEQGKPKKIKKKEAIVRKLFGRAMKGDHRAIKTLMELSGAEEDTQQNPTETLGSTELDDIKTFVAWLESDEDQGGDADPEESDWDDDDDD